MEFMLIESVIERKTKVAEPGEDQFMSLFSTIRSQSLRSQNVQQTTVEPSPQNVQESTKCLKQY